MNPTHGGRVENFLVLLMKPFAKIFFFKLMHGDFEMSMMKERKFFPII